LGTRGDHDRERVPAAPTWEDRRHAAAEEQPQGAVKRLGLISGAAQPQPYLIVPSIVRVNDSLDRHGSGSARSKCSIHTWRS
jgi:hypothetical protein